MMSNLPRFNCYKSYINEKSDTLNTKGENLEIQNRGKNSFQEVKMMDSALLFYVNGKKVEDSNVDPEETLLYYLRVRLKNLNMK